MIDTPSFFLGTHEPSWLATARVPLFISRRRLARQKRQPRAIAAWALDSGGFTELQLHGKWTMTADQYAREARRYRDEIGLMQWAAPQDWMCEPHMLARTGLTVGKHQARTVQNYLELSAIAPDMPWIPVLQGWTEGDYYEHIEAYARAGVRLEGLKLVGIGSVCRRQGTGLVANTAARIASFGINLHGFGVKTNGLRRCYHSIKSVDSLAWSYNARRNPGLPGHEQLHKRCQNCLAFALLWRSRLLAKLDEQGEEPPFELPFGRYR